jgi:hypothetical protein
MSWRVFPGTGPTSRARRSPVVLLLLLLGMDDERESTTSEIDSIFAAGERLECLAVEDRLRGPHGRADDGWRQRERSPENSLVLKTKGSAVLPHMGEGNGQVHPQQSPEIVNPPPGARMPIPDSAAGTHAQLTRRTSRARRSAPRRNRTPRVSRTALEEPDRANAVPSRGVGEPDAKLGETLPKFAFFDRPSFPARLDYHMGGERAASFHQTPGRDQRLRRRKLLPHARLRRDFWNNL